MIKPYFIERGMYSYVSIKRPVLLKDLFENILKGFY